MPYEIVVRRTDRYDQPRKFVRKSLALARGLAEVHTRDGRHKATIAELKYKRRHSHRRVVETIRGGP